MYSKTFKRHLLRSLLSTRVAIATGLLCVSNARANEQILQLAEPFYEAFLDSPPPPPTRGVVGAAIVGLRLDGPGHPFEPRAVRILLGDISPRPDLLCAKFLSRDGRYFARGKYKLTGVNDPAPLLDFHTRYQQQLKEYATTDFAMFAVSGKSCDELKGAQLFVVHDGKASDARKLLVQIRAGDARVHAQLGRDNSAVGPAVLCERPANGPTVAYTAECALPLPTPFQAGRYQLSIGETGSGGEMVVKTYFLVLATAGKDESK